MDAQRSERSDRGGAKGPNRRSTSVFVSSIAAFFVLFLAPLALVAFASALPPAGASGDVSVLFLAVFAVGSLAIAGFGVIGARIARSGGSRGLALYGWTVAVVLIASGTLYGVAAILRSIA